MTSSEQFAAATVPVPGSWRPPPRNQLPPGLTIEKVPPLGTSWYERGLSYWLRRAGILLVFAALAAFMIAIIVVVLRDARQSSWAAFYVLLWVEIVYSLVIVMWLLRREIRMRRGDPAEIRSYRQHAKARRSAAAGTAGADLARATSSILTAVIVVFGSFLTAGFVIAILIMYSRPVLTPEIGARHRFWRSYQIFATTQEPHSGQHHRHPKKHPHR